MEDLEPVRPFPLERLVDELLIVVFEEVSS
jgi:hypothetical protein